MRVLAHDMCSCRVFCVSYFVEFFVRENSCRIQRETRSGGLELEKRKYARRKNGKKGKERSGIVP